MMETVYIDLADAGCDNRGDKDETNCDDDVCEGREDIESCLADCGQPDSCSDTDGGFEVFAQGTVSGYQSGEPYSYTDYCNSTTLLLEYYCGADSPYSWVYDCSLNATACIDGACVF